MTSIPKRVAQADTILNGTIYAISGKIADKIIPINKGWFSPKRLKTMLFGNYSKKISYNSVIQEYTGVTAKSITNQYSYNTGQTSYTTPSFGGGGGGGHYAM